MKSQPESLNEQIRRASVEKMWLNYFNRTLLEKGMITETEYTKMSAQINCRKGPFER